MLQGRHVLWGWLQERRKAGSYDYSGCMTVPRLLYLEDERLIQVRPVCLVTACRRFHLPAVSSSCCQSTTRLAHNVPVSLNRNHLLRSLLPQAGGFKACS